MAEKASTHKTKMNKSEHKLQQLKTGRNIIPK